MLDFWHQNLLIQNQTFGSNCERKHFYLLAGSSASALTHLRTVETYLIMFLCYIIIVRLCCRTERFLSEVKGHTDKLGLLSCLNSEFLFFFSSRLFAFNSSAGAAIYFRIRTESRSQEDSSVPSAPSTSTDSHGRPPPAAHHHRHGNRLNREKQEG